MRRIALLLLCSLVAACSLDEMLEVEQPGRVAVEALDDPTLATTLRPWEPTGERASARGATEAP